MSQYIVSQYIVRQAISSNFLGNGYEHHFQAELGDHEWVFERYEQRSADVRTGRSMEDRIAQRYNTAACICSFKSSGPTWEGNLRPNLETDQRDYRCATRDGLPITSQIHQGGIDRNLQTRRRSTQNNIHGQQEGQNLLRKDAGDMGTILSCCIRCYRQLRGK